MDLLRDEGDWAEPHPGHPVNSAPWEDDNVFHIGLFHKLLIHKGSFAHCGDMGGISYNLSQTWHT